MEQENHHPSAEFRCLVGPAELNAFKRQLHNYADFLVQYVKKRKQEEEQIVENPVHFGLLTNRLTETYHIQCRLLQLVQWLYENAHIRREVVEEVLQVVPVILRDLIDPPTDKTEKHLACSHEWLSILDCDYLRQLVWVHSTSSELTVHDHLLWAQLERHQVPHLWWNWRRLTKTAESSGSLVAENVAPAIQLTTSQQRGLELLTEIYSLHRQNKCVAGISPQPRPLLIGPSGSGKTALVRHFAEKNYLPLLDLNPATWIVSGAASGRTTLRLIRKFLCRESEGVIYIDELDKFIATTDWMRSVQQECMALIDRRTASFEDWSQEDQFRLEKFFIVGAGTWQSLCYEDNQILGFGLTENIDLMDKLTKQKQIPDEILFRFPHLIELKGLSASDFKQRIGKIRAELKLPILSKESLTSLVHEAVKSRRQIRWLEQYVVQALRERAFPQ